MKNTKILAALCVGLAISACTPTAKTPKDFPELLKQTAGFEDCKIVQLENSIGTVLNIVRCPNSTTSVTRPGKSPSRTITVDGEQDEHTN